MKKLLAVLICMLLVVGNAFAINDWRQGTNSAPIEGTVNPSDIDTNSENYAFAPLDKLLTNSIHGCSLTYASASTITVGIGEVNCTDGTIHRFRKNVATTTLDMAVVGVGGIDSGSAEAASTLYSVYAVADANATTFTVICGEQGTALSDVTYYRYIGSFLNNGSSNIEPFYWSGNGPTIHIEYDDVYLNTTLRVLNVGAAVAFTDVDCSGIVPSTSRSIDLQANTGSGCGLYLRANGSSATNGIYFRPITTDDGNGQVCNVPTDTSQVIEYKVSAANSTLYVAGYDFVR